MEFSSITKQNIEKITGVRFSELLEREIYPDERLNKLVRHKRRDKLDLLVHGNPQLMHGRVTSIEEVEEYFSKKLKSINT